LRRNEAVKRCEEIWAFSLLESALNLVLLNRMLLPLWWSLKLEESEIKTWTKKNERVYQTCSTACCAVRRLYPRSIEQNVRKSKVIVIFGNVLITRKAGCQSRECYVEILVNVITKTKSYKSSNGIKDFWLVSYHILKETLLLPFPDRLVTSTVRWEILSGDQKSKIPPSLILPTSWSKFG
jgi:hypothetical protein